MGVSDLRDAFNDAAGGLLTCSRATLAYDTHDGVQYQILTFYGTSQDGSPFVERSERLRPETDVNLAAREVAKKLIIPREPPP